MTDTSVSCNFRAARRRPWPARMPAFVSTNIGLLKPNSAMLAAIWAIWASECVLGFRAKGINLSISHSSICLATACRIMPHLKIQLSRGIFRRVRFALACRTGPVLSLYRIRPDLYSGKNHNRRCMFQDAEAHRTRDERFGLRQAALFEPK